MADDEISYEFNTTGFYNILSDQLLQNNDVLSRISKKAANRLKTKRAEYNTLILSPSKANKVSMRNHSMKENTTPKPQSDKISSERQLAKVKAETDPNPEQTEKISDKQQKKEFKPEAEDWSHYKLSNLYLLESPTASFEKKEAKISPMESFINREQIDDQIQEAFDKMNVNLEELEKEFIAKYPDNSTKLTKVQTEFASETTGDDVVDSMLMKLSAHMTI